MAETGDTADAGTDPPPMAGRVRGPGTDRPRHPGATSGELAPDLLERVTALLAGGEVQPNGARAAGELIEEVGSGDVWSAVGVLHEFLDRRLVQGELSPEECRRLRSRLVSLSRTMAGEQVRSERRRSRRLLAGVARDLRSTLHSVVFLVEALHSGHSGGLGDRQRRQLGVVFSATTSLLNRVDSLVDWTRRAGEGGEGEEQGEVPRDDERFSVSEVVARVRGLARPIVESQAIRFSSEVVGGDVCRGDPEVVARVALNLVANALAAAGRDGWVELHVGCGDDALRLAVRDSSEGSPEEIRWLADLLERSEPPDVASCLEEDGHGLGLCICARLLVEAGGTASVEVLEDRVGRRIVVSFPYPAAGDQADSAD